MIEPDNDGLCVGICSIDIETGYCLGCGRPPLPQFLMTPPGGDVQDDDQPGVAPRDERPGSASPAEMTE